MTAVLSAPAAAQSVSGQARPALPTFYGDTGLWFVPTAETLPSRQWSTSLYRSNWNREQGVTDVAQIGVTGAFGVTDRLEVFTSWRLVRLSRGVRDPLFVSSAPSSGSVQQEYPYLARGWSSTLGGPIDVGGKWNLISQARGDAMSVAARVMLTIPVGSPWAGTNAVDAHGDLIMSRELDKRVEVTSMFGGVLRRHPDEFQVSDGVRWGLGATFPTRSKLRALVEYEGEFTVRDNTVVLRPPVVAEDGSLAPLLSPNHDPANVKAGLVWQSSKGYFLHGGVNYSKGGGDRTVAGRRAGDGAWDVEVRVGFHSGARTFAPPPPPPSPPPPVAAAPPPAPAPPPNRNPTLSAIGCAPCIVEVGKTSQLTVTGSGPDGDPLTYRWSGPTGTFAAPTASSTVWTAPMQEGNVPVTATATDPRGGIATSTLTLQVIKAPVKTFTFEDVHFDFDKFTLKPEAVKVLDDAVSTLRDNPDLRVTLEGHCDSEGTAEYNLALGERRAKAAREYLVSRGVAPNRLEAVSYGEERPKADNSTEAGRALNRRATLVVKIQ